MDLLQRYNIWKIISILFSVLQLVIGQMPDFAGMGMGDADDSAPVLDTTSETITVKQGEMAILPCHVRNTGNTTVMWTYGGEYKQLATGVDIMVDDPRFSIQHRNNDEWNFVINTVQFDDAKDYKCTVLYFPPQEKYVTLHVFGLPQIDKDQLQDRYMFREGQSVSIECVVSGPDDLQVRWFAFKTDHSSREEQKEQVSNNRYLTIGQMSRDRDGIYRCEASNQYGKDMYEILLQTAYAPVPRVLEQKAVVKIGHPIKLTCEAEGQPLPNMAWYHRNAAIINNFKYHLAQYTESETKKISELTIQLTEQADTGLYVCSAANKYGRSDAEIKVTVISENEEPSSELKSTEANKITTTTDKKVTPLDIQTQPAEKSTETTTIKYVDPPKTGESSNAVGVTVSKPILALASLAVSYIIATVL